MPRDVQAKMEYAFGADFSAVRIHEGAEAAAMGAHAFAQGTEIHFAPGQYAPGSQQGQGLLGHELAHVVQQAQGRVPGATQAKGATGAPIHDDPALEREADVMGARAARGQRAAGAAASAGADHASRAPGPMLPPASPALQAKSAEEQPLWANAEEDAAALLDAFQGLGTTEQVVYRVLNQPPEVVKAVLGLYNSRYNRHTGQGLVEDLRAEFYHLGGRADWQFVVGQLARAGISVPGAEARYERQDPTAAEQRHARIVATPNVRVAVPGTRITYAMVRGAEQHAPGSRYTYQWYVLNDPETAQKLGYPVRVEGSEGPQVEATARFVGNHKVICKEIYDPASGPPRPPVFYEFPQTVVPEGTLAQDALKHAPAAVDPARQLEVLETFRQVLREAEQQPGSSPLDPKTAAAYEQQIAALRKRLASTEGAERIPIQAVHVDREKARVSPLRAFVARTQGGEPGEQETWRLVDITNPESRRLSGEYEGRGKDARAAIFAALAAWDQGNRYPTGRIRLELGAEVAGEAITHELQTDGMSFWDSISEFFAEVGFWTGMGALAMGVATAVAPVPGSRAVSALVWASILASSASAAINIAQRHAEGMSSAREDAMDVLTIAGNILAGAWMRGARVLVNAKGGTRIGTGLLIGQFGTDGAQGILLGVEYLDQYDRVMAIEDPKQRTDALMELLRSAALAGGMLFISIQGTRSDLGQLGKPGAQVDPSRLGNQGEVLDLDAPAKGTHDQGGISGAEPTTQSPRQDGRSENEASSAGAHPDTPSWDNANLAPQVRHELMQLRGEMNSPETMRLFDEFVTQQRSPEQALRALQGMRRGQRDIEQTLRKRAAKHAARTAVHEPYGEAVAEALELAQQARDLDVRVAQSGLQGKEGWQQPRLRAELGHLAEIQAGRKEATNERVQGIQNNIRGIEAELHDALERGADQVNVDIEYAGGKLLDIDNISNGGRTWTEVKASEPFTTHSETWTEEIFPKAQKMLQAAQEHGVSDLRFSFTTGVDPSVKLALEKMGLTVEGPLVPVHSAGNPTSASNGSVSGADER